jgi:FixJ family two-component response regulator
LEHRDPEVAGCVVTDLQMPRRSGLDLQDALGRSGRSLPVIFLTAKGDIPTTVRAMRGGAEDFLTKRAPKAQLLGAIDRALQRQQREAVERDRSSASRSKLEKLTARELQVLSGVAGIAQQADRRRVGFGRSDSEAPPRRLNP